MVVLTLSMQAGPAPGRVPVVVELFTSEGCSSCPPADILLSTLARQDTIAGAQVIPLGLHVTYWDQLGWKDPASLQAATDRQQDYGRVFGADSMYTPEAVIDGHSQMIGSDEEAVRRAIAKAALEPHGTVALSVSTQSDTVTARLTVNGIRASETLHNIFFVTEDGLTSIVRRGENGGRTLHNDAVVRRIATTPKIGKLAPQWRRDRLHVVVIVQGEKTGRIYAAATVPVPQDR